MFARYLPYNSVNCGVGATLCVVLLVLDLSANMVGSYGEQYIVLFSMGIYQILRINGFKLNSFIQLC